jgi:hypothetical protein
MCSLVTGGKGSSLYPTSTGPEAVSSLVVSCAVMAAVVCVKRCEGKASKDLYPKAMTPSLGESTLHQGKVLVGRAIPSLRLGLRAHLRALRKPI